MLKLIKHQGVILEPSTNNFDEGGSTFGCVYKDDNGVDYLYYTGSKDASWSKTSIGLALSSDGIHFKKCSEPLLSRGKIALTPAVFKSFNRFWMIFAYEPLNARVKIRRLAIAVSDDPAGNWEFVKDLIKPEKLWEGIGIDIGPSVIPLSQNEFLIYYSNIPFLLINPKLFSQRHIGILHLKVSGSMSVEAKRWEDNPLSNLNGAKKSWNESLFCPGHFTRGEKHYLLPSASNYSIGFPYKQYIGIVEDKTPYFRKASINEILIDGHREKNLIMPSIKSEIALDTPSPLIKNDKLWIYYAVMDRSDSIWKTALSIYALDS